MVKGSQGIIIDYNKDDAVVGPEILGINVLLPVEELSVWQSNHSGSYSTPLDQGIDVFLGYRASRQPPNLTTKHLSSRCQLRLRNPNMTGYEGDEALSVLLNRKVRDGCASHNHHRQPRFYAVQRR